MITPLYSGDDLENAADATQTAAGGGGGWRGYAAPAGEIARYLFGSARKAPMAGCREVVTRGRERGSAIEIVLRYVGTMENFHYLQSLVFDDYETVAERTLWSPLSVVGALRPRRRDEEILLVDAESPMAEAIMTRPALRLPQWVKQRLAVAPRWAQVVEGLPRFTRRGVSRYLRKYGYTGRVNATEEALDQFYHRLYEPHVRRRYRDGAVVVEKRRFMALARGCKLVELVHDGEVIGANLMRASGQAMFILWCGQSDLVRDKDLKGATDALDYFCLLHAFQSGCGMLDFGPSRPRLNDGVMMYKAKWGAVLVPGRVPKPAMLVVPARTTPAVIALLARNHFVTRTRRGLCGNILVEGDPLTAGRIEDLVATYRPPGLDRLRLLSLGGFEASVRDGDRPRGVDLVDLRAGEDPVTAYLAG